MSKTSIKLQYCYWIVHIWPVSFLTIKNKKPYPQLFFSRKKKSLLSSFLGASLTSQTLSTASHQEMNSVS